MWHKSDSTEKAYNSGHVYNTGTSEPGVQYADECCGTFAQAY